MNKGPNIRTPDPVIVLAEVLDHLTTHGAMRVTALAAALGRSRETITRAVEMGLREGRLTKYEPTSWCAPVFGLFGVPFAAPKPGPVRVRAPRDQKARYERRVTREAAAMGPTAPWLHPIPAGTASQAKYAPTLPMDYSDPRFRPPRAPTRALEQART